MDNKKIIVGVIGIVVIALVVCVGIYAFNVGNGFNSDNATVGEVNNSSVNLTNNSSNDASSNLDSSDKSSSVSSDSSSNSNSNSNSNGVWKENYQQGDGSKYREVTGADGNIRQYDESGNLIGSTYESDQKELENKYGIDE